MLAEQGQNCIRCARLIWLRESLLQEQNVGCYVRNDPRMPVQRILRTLLRMKMSGEIDDIIRLYIGGEPLNEDNGKP